jgi:hypothetical protein
MQAVTNFFNEEDINGDPWVVGAEGEREELIDKNRVIFPAKFPCAKDGEEGQEQNLDPLQVSSFVVLNARWLVHCGLQWEVAFRLAYVRLLIARRGLISPEFTLAAHYVRYNDAVYETDDEIKAIIADEEFPDELKVADDVKAVIARAFPAGYKKNFRTTLTDRICIVAYMFRSRAHHYMDDFEARYNTLWQRCLHSPEDVIIPWKEFATAGVHAIMPIVLDAYWRDSCEKSRCAGALIKRFDCAPAGAAVIWAVKRGFQDVHVIFKGLDRILSDEVRNLSAQFDLLYNKRWEPSVNARYYGVQRIVVKEAEFSVMGAVIRGIYSSLAENSPLLQSKALERIALANPVTGSALGLIAARDVKSERLTILAAPAAEQDQGEG